MTTMIKKSFHPTNIHLKNVEKSSITGIMMEWSVNWLPFGVATENWRTVQSSFYIIGNVDLITVIHISLSYIKNSCFDFMSSHSTYKLIHQFNTFSATKREKWTKINQYVKEKFDDARSQRLSVKDSNLEDWALEKNNEVDLVFFKTFQLLNVQLRLFLFCQIFFHFGQIFSYQLKQTPIIMYFNFIPKIYFFPLI